MDMYEKAMEVMEELFAKDCVFAMATAQDNRPSVRFVDTFFQDGSFFVVTHAKTQKVRELETNSHVALSNHFYRFSGYAHNIGHPLTPENQELRSKLIEVFEPWYFPHNDENDQDMCYVRIELVEGFFCKDGMGYAVNFLEKMVEVFPFDRD
jgi:general stress protein 26